MDLKWSVRYDIFSGKHREEMRGLQKEETDQEPRKHMWMRRHEPTLHHVVDTEISEMCVVNDSRDVKSDQVLVDPVQWSLVPSHEYEFYSWAGENNKMMEFKRTSRTAESLNIPG